MTAVFERASRLALVTSVAAITVLQLAFHPDLTPALRWAGVAALVAGVLVGPLRSGLGVAVWIVAAPLSPALLRRLTGLEGPVLDVVWMAGLAGALLRAAPRPVWHLPPAWRLLLGGWALVLTLAWPMVAARELAFDWSLLRDDAAINSWAQLTAGRVVAWSLYVVVTQLLALLWFDWLAGQWARKQGKAPRALHALWIGVSVASVVAVYQGAVDLRFLSTEFWANERRAAATLLDANGYGMLAALAAPVAGWWLRSRLPLAFALVAVNGIGLWLSGSRTALLCGIAGLMGLGVSATFARRRPAWTGTKAAAGVLAVTLVLGAIVVAGDAIGPLRRIAEVPVSRAGLSALWNRGGYGSIAVQMIRETPWTGAGPGMYHVIAPDYWRVQRQMTLAFDNAQNWWRHQTAELGFLGASPVIVWSLLLAAGVLTARSRDGRSDVWLPRTLLLGLGAASLVGMPTQNPVVLLWFFALVAWWAAATTGAIAEGRVPPRVAGGAAAVIAALVLTHAAGTVVLARGWLSVPERAKRAHREYVRGAYPPEPLGGSTTYQWTGPEAHFLWAGSTRWMLLRVWVQHPDAASSPVGVTLSTPCQTLVTDELRSSEPITIGIELPDGTQMLEATLRSSRTWQPAPEGKGDSRHLGAAVVAVFVSNADDARMTKWFVTPRACDFP